MLFNIKFKSILKKLQVLFLQKRGGGRSSIRYRASIGNYTVGYFVVLLIQGKKLFCWFTSRKFHVYNEDWDEI